MILFILKYSNNSYAKIGVAYKNSKVIIEIRPFS